MATSTSQGHQPHLDHLDALLLGRRPRHTGWRYAFRLRDIRAAFAKDYQTWDISPWMVV